MKAIFFMKELDASLCPGCKWYSNQLQQEGGFATVIKAFIQELHPSYFEAHHMSSTQPLCYSKQKQTA